MPVGWGGFAPRPKGRGFPRFDKDLEGSLMELLKFLYLSSKYSELKKNFIPVTQEIDELWHYFIIQTAYYQKLCSVLPGGAFLHHASLTFDEYREVKIKKDLIVEILRWIVLYVRNFGELKEDRLRHWFFIHAVKRTLNISLMEMNRLAKDDTFFQRIA